MNDPHFKRKHARPLPTPLVLPHRKRHTLCAPHEFLTPYFDKPLDAVTAETSLSRSTIKAVAPSCPHTSAHSVSSFLHP